jgi:NADH dehydrogenase FAD-containing subunit
LHLGARAVAIDAARREVQVENGSRHSYDALLIATGAEPVRLDVPGGNLPRIHYLRSLADSRAIIEKAETTQRAVVIGASFIAIEVAASLCARKLEVHVVAPESIPASLVADVDRYLEHFRPVLLTRGGRQNPAACDAFWVSGIATALDPNSIPNRIKKHRKRSPIPTLRGRTMG